MSQTQSVVVSLQVAPRFTLLDAKHLTGLAPIVGRGLGPFLDPYLTI